MDHTIFELDILELRVNHTIFEFDIFDLNPFPGSEKGAILRFFNACLLSTPNHTIADPLLIEFGPGAKCP